MRDNQRARLYRAERAAFPEFDDRESFHPPLEDLQGFVDRVCRTKPYRELWRGGWTLHSRLPIQRRVLVDREGGDRRRISSWGGGVEIHRGRPYRTIALAPHHRHPAPILHEIAHCCDPTALHNPRFAGTYLALVGAHMGPEWELALRREMVRQGVGFKWL
jgi:hypothetical protein